MENRSDGTEVKKMYRYHELNMLDEYVKSVDSGFGCGFSIQRIHERIKTGQLSIMSHLSMLLDVIRIYHRKDGRVVDVRDDLISAVRYLEMMLRFFKEPGNARYKTYNGPLVCKGSIAIL